MSEERRDENGQLLVRRVVKRRERVKKRETEADIESRRFHRWRNALSRNVLLLLIAILVSGIGFAGWRWIKDRKISRAYAKLKDLETTQTASQYMEKGKLLKLVNSNCLPVLWEYLSAKDSYGRAQVVENGSDLMLEMLGYDANQMPISVSGASIFSVIDALVWRDNDKKGISTAWKVDDHEVIEANFYLTKTHLRLDWKSFVRYQEVNWGLFLAGTIQQEEATFFLYLRPYEDEKLAGSLDLGFQLCEPIFGKPQEFRLLSPVMIVRRSSEAGQMIEKALKKENVAVPMLEVMKPAAGMIRVQARVRRVKKSATESDFQLVKLDATDWVSAPKAETEKK